MKAKIYPLNTAPSEVDVKASPFCLHLEIICASLSRGKTTIKNIINSKDINTTIKWCKAIGANIRKDEDKIVVRGINNKISYKQTLFVCDNSTTAKLMIPLFCLVSHPIGIKTNDIVIEELNQYSHIYEEYGVSFYVEEGMIRFEKIMQPKEVEFDGDLDIYIAAGLLLALPLLKGNSVFKLKAPIRDEKTYATILKILKTFSVDIKHPATMRYDINGNQKYKKASITTEKDCMLLAHYTLLSTLLNNDKSILLNNYRRNSTLDSERLLEIMQKNATEYKNYLFSKQFKKKEYAFRKLEASPENSLPLLMVLASLNSQDSFIDKVDFNKKRVKKQYNAMSKAFTKLNITHSSFESEIVVNPANVTIKKQVDSYNDPYVVMALSFLALVSKSPIIIRDIDCVFNIYQDFFNDLKKIGAVIEFIHN